MTILLKDITKKYFVGDSAVQAIAGGAFAAFARRVLYVRDGKIVNDEQKEGAEACSGKVS